MRDRSNLCQANDGIVGIVVVVVVVVAIIIAVVAIQFVKTTIRVWRKMAARDCTAFVTNDPDEGTVVVTVGWRPCQS
jgi:hypothetical protein